METQALSFDAMSIAPEFLEAVRDMGFTKPTTIQEESIRIMKSGRDVIGQSQTGTGKTVAFGIPCLEAVDPTDRRLQSLILCPTRELAIQISEEFRRLLKFKPSIKVLPIYGGQPIDRQIMALKRGIQVVIGTPGRVMDHMRRRTLKMGTVKMVILDEADEMLDMGFREDIETILKEIPEDRQTMLYSATLSPEIMDIAKKYTRDPQTIKVSRKELTVSNIEQAYYDIRDRAKPEALCRLLDFYSPDLSIIFCNTKRKVDSVSSFLQSRGYQAEGLHGDLKQSQRDKVMQGFRSGSTKILVATDVAARGIDVDDVDIVFNYDLPQDEEYYVHRIGRTGRAGRSGRALSFVVGREIYKLRDIMRYAKTQVGEQKLPGLQEIESHRIGQLTDGITKLIGEGGLENARQTVDSLADQGLDPADIAAALLQMRIADMMPSTANASFDESGFEPERKRNIQPVRGSAAPRRRRNDANMVRLSVNVGRNNQIQPKDIVGAIAGETGISGKLIGAVDIFENHTFVDIPKEHVPNVLKIMDNNTIKGRRVNIEQVKVSVRKKNG